MPEPATGPLVAAVARIDKQQADTAAHMACGLAELMRDRQQAFGWRLMASDALAFGAGGGLAAAGIIIGSLLLCR